MNTRLMNRNVTVRGRRTSARLEPEFWTHLRRIAQIQDCSIHDIATDLNLAGVGLTSALRVFVVNWLAKEAGQS